MIATEAAALRLATAAGDTDDTAYTLANLHALVKEAQTRLLDEQTITETAPGCWRTNGRLTLPTHVRQASPGQH